MAKKKETEFDTETYITNMDIPVWIKSGFLYHIEVKKLTFKSEKDLEKEYNKFMEGRD